MKTRIVIAGGTGLVGKQVVAELAGAKTVELHALLRAYPENLPASVVPHVSDPSDWGASLEQVRPDVLISCLGTTLKTAGSRDAFRAVDHDLVVALAKAARAAAARQFVGVSSVGASAASRNFYLKTKGAAEDAVRALDFERTDFLHPGLLTGGHRAERRPAEALAILVSPLTDGLMLGPLARYRSTPSAKVAKAIVTLALGGGYGKHIHGNDAMDALSG